MRTFPAPLASLPSFLSFTLPGSMEEKISYTLRLRFPPDELSSLSLERAETSSFQSYSFPKTAENSLKHFSASSFFVTESHTTQSPPPFPFPFGLLLCSSDDGGTSLLRGFPPHPFSMTYSWSCPQPSSLSFLVERDFPPKLSLVPYSSS